MQLNKYNGLNWLITKQANTPGSAGGLDQQRMRFYGASWQLCEERIDDESPFTTDPDDADIDRHVQYIGGARYIDDCIARREDNNVDGTYDDTWYHITDVQFSTVAILDSSAGLVERISYDAYGKARHHYMADWDGDGDVSSADITAIETTANGSNHAIGEANYNVDQDIDRDGDVTLTDHSIASTEGTHNALAAGLISDPTIDNQIGWDSYCFHAETQLSNARFRWYDHDLGRFIEKEPFEYAFGMNLFQYGSGSPRVMVDPSGLNPISSGEIWTFSGINNWCGTNKMYEVYVSELLGIDDAREIVSTCGGRKRG